MNDKGNLADPSFEPSDEQLQGLVKRAFDGVVDRHLKALEALREEIADLRKQVLSDLERTK